MRFVPSFPPPITVPEEGLEAKALARVKPVKPIQARTLPPLVVQRHARPENPSGLSGQQEKRRDTHVHGERRTYCRRIEHLPILFELRSVPDRRRQRQREGDVTGHVDEEV